MHINKLLREQAKKAANWLAMVLIHKWKVGLLVDRKCSIEAPKRAKKLPLWPEKTLASWFMAFVDCVKNELWLRRRKRKRRRLLWIAPISVRMQFHWAYLNRGRHKLQISRKEAFKELSWSIRSRFYTKLMQHFVLFSMGLAAWQFDTRRENLQCYSSCWLLPEMGCPWHK